MSNPLTASRFAALCAAAIAAPSADNRRVFQLQVGTDGLRLLAAHDLVRATMNRRILDLISVGAVTENMMLRGAAIGLRLEPKWRQGGGEESLLAVFACSEAPIGNDSLEPAIERRHSNRRLRFTGPRLADAAKDQFSAEASAVDGASLVWFDRPGQRRHALQLIRWAETERFRNEALHRELFESIRFDLGWNASATEGLAPGSLELPWFERPAFQLLRSWRVQRVANVLGMHRFMGWRGADLPCRLAPHLCAVTAAGDVETAAVNAGRLLQRAWLRATTLGLSLQVFAASPLYALDSSTSIAEDLRRRLASGWRELCAGERPFVVFRMGYAAEPSVRAQRPIL